MPSRLRALGLTLLAAHALSGSAIAAATVHPYLRVGYGVGQLRMTDFNSATQDGAPFYAIGARTSGFEDAGPAFGPSASAGLWLSPGIRVGLTYSRQHATLDHFLNVPGDVLFDDHTGFTLTEIGAEASVRYEKMAGLTLGASVASGHARFERDFSGQDLVGVETLHLDINARKTRLTYGVFAGLDQTNKAGLAGWIMAGFKLRDMGRMTQSGTLNDGATTSPASGITPWMDYSGFYLAVGTGYDWRR